MMPEIERDDRWPLLSKTEIQMVLNATRQCDDVIENLQQLNAVKSAAIKEANNGQRPMAIKNQKQTQ
jgi:hypothetical protein